MAWRPLALPDVRPGVTHAQAISALEDLHRDLGNIRGGGWLASKYQADYLQWVDRAERQFRHLFVGPSAMDHLHTRRYWQLQTPFEDVAGSSRAADYGLVYSEMETQLDRLDTYLRQLRHEAEHFSLDDGESAFVFDTNVFLHVRAIDQIKWREEFPGAVIRLVIPLVVIDELDKLSYSQNKLVRERAKGAVNLLRTVRGDDADAEDAVEVPHRDSVRTQILLDPWGHRRQSNIDAEILDRAEHLASMTGSAVTVGSGDYGVQLRALNRGLSVWQPPEHLDRTLQAKAPSE